MAQITAALVKTLREKSGAGVMDCKKALAGSGGDLDGAVDWLRKKGLAAAARKAGRVAAEGLVAVAAAGEKGVIVEVNAETDFVARNERFQRLVQGVARAALNTDGSIAAVAAADLDGAPVSDRIAGTIAAVGENMTLRRSASLEVSGGVVAAYAHSAVKPGLGKIGVLAALESGGDASKLVEAGKQIAMHIAAAAPLFLDRSSADPAAVAREREVLIEQARASGKPEDVIGKMIDGRMRKYYQEVCLLDQVFVIDGETRVSKVVEKLGEDVGAPVALKGFARFALGEGVEKQRSDFLTEVAAAARG